MLSDADCFARDEGPELARIDAELAAELGASRRSSTRTGSSGCRISSTKPSN
jgi:hypothetical protein